MSTLGDAHQQAAMLLQKLRDKTSLDGQGVIASSDFTKELARILDEERPTANAIAIAGWMAPSVANHEGENRWGPKIIGALEDVFRLCLNDEQIATQEKLAESNDRLGSSMLSATWVGVGVGITGVGVTVALAGIVAIGIILAGAGIFPGFVISLKWVYRRVQERRARA